MATVELAELIVADGATWQAWLGQHHPRPPGVWLVLAKKNTTDPTRLTHDVALEEALCHGWIDGQMARRDAGTYRERFTPRLARSQWSAPNVGIVSRLIRQGRMEPAGMGQVARARADGRWDAAYSGQAGTEVPADLNTALAAAPQHGRCSRSSPARTASGCSTGSILPNAPTRRPVVSGVRRHARLWRDDLPRSPRLGN